MDHVDFTLGSGDFTVDCWAGCSAAAGTTQRFAGQAASGLAAATAAWFMERLTTGEIRAYVSTGSAFVTVTSTTTFISMAGPSKHIALVRTGNILRLFIDGVQEGGDQAFTGSVNDSAEDFRIGAAGEETVAPWTGWLDEFRLSVGVARWTANFTPPAAEYGEQAIEIEGTYTAISITNVDNFVIAIGSLPDSAGVFAMNGGEAQIAYYIALGPTTSGTGYGTGTYGTGTYGIGAVGAAQEGTPVAAADWTLDNWGDALLACPEDGGIYTWRPNTGLETAQLIAEGPIANAGMFVSQQTQMVIAFGSTTDLDIGLDRDPLLVKWCDNGNFLSWAIAVDSQAGSRRLSTGSKIIGGLSVAQQELLWTDLGLWSMSYLGSLAAGVWGFNQIGVNCGLIGKHAVARFGAYVYWMSPANFFRLGQSPEVLPCTVWDVVFQDLNEEHQHKSWAWPSTLFNEIWYFFARTSTGATEPDYYVKVNVVEGAWDHGPLPRSCGIDQSILGKPISATPTGIIYQHETSPDADGVPMVSSFTTGFFQISDGWENMFVDWVLPDYKFAEFPGTSGATIQITLYSQYYTSGPVQIHGPFTVTAATSYFNPRLRGRLVSMKVESSDLGSWWRLGGLRVRSAPDGRVP